MNLCERTKVVHVWSVIDGGYAGFAEQHEIWDQIMHVSVPCIFRFLRGSKTSKSLFGIILISVCLLVSHAQVVYGYYVHVWQIRACLPMVIFGRMFVCSTSTLRIHSFTWHPWVILLYSPHRKPFGEWWDQSLRNEVQSAVARCSDA